MYSKHYSALVKRDKTQVIVLIIGEGPETGPVHVAHREF